MAKKSNKTLEKRIETLKERGIDCTFTSKEVTIADIADVISDLTLDEYNRMFLISHSQIQAEGRRRGFGANEAMRESDRQRTLARREEI